MKRLLLAVVLSAGLFSMAALADKTITTLTAGSKVTSMSFDVSVPGQVAATVCGRAPLQAGGFSQPTCYPVTLSAGGVFTAVNALAAGAALTFWQGQEGL